MENNTASLRNAAPKWTLAGDKQLLDILQNIHQSLMTRCQEVNRRLDEMVTALDDASVDLQNVNNKFMALSNSQFIESRVYDDDVEVTEQQQPKEAVAPSEGASELDGILHSVRALEQSHEVIHIVGSDSESDSESELNSVVLKPKDIYSHRPLPLVIGTSAWRNKWHAGLIVEDSDTDSTTSKPEVPDDEYSDSEPDGPIFTREFNELTVSDTQESTTSSELQSEQDLVPPIAKPSPSDVAAELARRLRGDPPEIREEDIPSIPAQPTIKKIYRPEQPAAGTIFSDEPPPFEGYQSEEEQYSQEEDDDIFAELHKKPYSNTNKVQNRVVEDLFGGLKDDRGDVFNDLANTKPPSTAANQKSTLFEDESEPELFTTKPVSKPIDQHNDSPAEAIKKPVGGISLFGSNKGAESIGAAILKRNRRKSSSEEDNASEETPKPIHNANKPIKSTEKDIFDDLFAKSEREQKVAKKEVVVVSEVKSNKIDLFSDNLFDDIDDIFATDVVKINSKSTEKHKSLFDDDEDDLFSNVAVSESIKEEVKNKSQTKKIFDSDDDLFSENVKPETRPSEEKSKTQSKSQNSNTGAISKTNKSIFDDDSSDSDIFSKLSQTKGDYKNSAAGEVKSSNFTENEQTSSVLNVNNDHETPDVNNVLNNNVNTKVSVVEQKEKPKFLFDDEGNDGDDDLFNKTNKNKTMNNENTKTSVNSTSIKATNKETPTMEIKTTKASLFEDDPNVCTGSNVSSIKYDKDKPPPINEEDNITKEYNIFHTVSKDLDNEERFNSLSQNSNTVNISDDSTTGRKDTKIKSSIFGDEDNGELLFGNANKKSNNSTESRDISNKFVDNRVSPTNTKSDECETISNETVKVKGESNVYNEVETLPKTKVELEPSNLTKNIKPDNLESDFDSSFKSMHEENNSFLNTVKDVVFNNSGEIFSDVIDEPPAFEKATEPKRSKNVNALFDDDSDDEALFFKKNDVTFDEKPNVNSDNRNDPIFGIFHDEPPAIDIDFSANQNKTIVSDSQNDFVDNLFQTIKKPERTSTDFRQNIIETKNDNNISPDTDDDLFKPKVKTTSSFTSNKITNSVNVPEHNKYIDDFLNTDSDSDLFQMPKQTEALTQKPVIATKTVLKHIETTPTFEVKSKVEVTEDTLNEQLNIDQDSEIVKVDFSSTKYESQSSDTPDSPEKIVGKLKSMNFNIDVNTLLPGASPKKKAVEQIDGQVLSAKSQEDLQKKDNSEPTIIKSVSFEGKPGSQILDNKISKERAKIQVKRRPSTRKARKEAVRKSVLDLGEDSTDNSSSFDDPPPIKTSKNPKKELNADNEQNKNNVESKREQIVKVKSSKLDTIIHIPSGNILGNPDTDITDQQHIDKVKTNIESDISKIDKRKDIANIKDATDSEYIKTESRTDIASGKSVSNKDDSKNVKSKLVYILNDEDIFNTPVEKAIENSKKITDTIDDEDDLFRNPVKIYEKASISTLGNVYRENNPKTDTNKTKKSLFDELSDEENELFNTNKRVTTKVKSILDSDSEDDLFSGKKEIKVKISNQKEKKDVKPKVEVKQSLFGDDDDDDDLFGAKIKINQGPSQPAKSLRDVVTKPPEPVLNDPLSLLGGDDD